MVIEHIQPFSEWLTWFLIQSGGAVLLLALLGLLLGFLRAMSTHGPTEGFLVVSRVLGTAFSDLIQMSPRRIWAIARLSFQEAVRRKVLVAFAVFLAVLLFAGWFLDVRSDHPARLYLEFVLTSTTYLCVLLGLFLSTLSLPNDIKQKTIYTVVTKPVRAGEIVLGRILGFTAIGTVVIVVMWAVSYVFVIRGLSHTHEVEIESFTAEVTPAASKADDVQKAPKKTKRRKFETLEGEMVAGQTSSPAKIVREGQTSLSAHHRHKVLVRADGVAYTEEALDHRHQVTVSGAGENATYTLGPPEGMLQARVPVYGELRFLDRAGNPGKGVNVGNEWMYRSFIEGRTPAAAIWMFHNVTPEHFGQDQLAVELNLRVFRTWKGDIESAVLGSIVLKNPTTGIRSEKFYLHPREFSVDRVIFPRKLNAVNEERKTFEVDLYKDLVDEYGNLEVVVQCEESGQYYGMAAADVYLRAGDRWFGWNFFKGYVTIWYQMVIVIAFGVMFSTFLSGPVAVLATLATLVMGYNRDFVLKFIYGVFQIQHDDAMEGGGSIEATIRVFNQANMTTPLSDTGDSTGVQVIQFFDRCIAGLLAVVVYMLPDYSGLTTSDYVAYGYDIAWGLLLQHGLKALFFVTVATGLGYFFLRTREIAA